MLREFVFLKLPPEGVGSPGSAPYRLDPPDDCVAVMECSVQPRIENLTPAPLWDIVLEAAYDASEHSPSRSAIVWREGAVETAMRFMTRTKVVFDGPRRGLRILSLPRRKDSLSPEQFYDHYANVHGRLVANCPPFREHMNCYVQHHVIPGTRKTLGEAPAPNDGISEFRVDSIEKALQVWRSPEYFAQVKPDEANFVRLRPEAGSFEDSKSHKLTALEREVYRRAGRSSC